MHDCSNAKTMSAPMKQKSVIENEIESLKNQVSRLNNLSYGISDMLMSSRPVCGSNNDKEPVRTIASSLNEILAVAEDTSEVLERIGRCLEEQLGSLKLEY